MSRACQIRADSLALLLVHIAFSWRVLDLVSAAALSSTLDEPRVAFTHQIHLELGKDKRPQAERNRQVQRKMCAGNALMKRAASCAMLWSRNG
eukprot:3169048-Rhodomonas_salina.1